MKTISTCVNIPALYRKLLLFAIAFAPLISFAQPANDNCSAAIAFASLATGGTCTNVTVNTATATQSSIGCNGTADDDVWYSFVVPTGYTAVNFKATSISGNTDRVFQFYSGTCGSLTNVVCHNADSGTAANLTAGATYYIRAYTWSTNVSSNFTLCLSLPPVNDICQGAIAFPTLTAGGGCTNVTVNTAKATQSAIGCNGSADDDVWYSFVVPAGYTAVNFKATSISGSTDRVFQFYSGTCGSLTNVSCLNADSGTAANLTAGATYYIRAYTWSTNVFSNFTLCLSLPPANDICQGAIAFPTLTPGGGCTNVTVNTAKATQSSIGCNGTADDDVWYSFVVPTGYTAVNFKATSISGNTDRVFQFYSGTCGSLTNVLCLNSDSGTAANLTAGATYYIRAYTWSTNVSSNFTLCLSLPPANDICQGAIAFPTLTPGGGCTNVTVNTAKATQSAIGCNGSADDDVWYSFVVPAGYTAVNFKATSISGNTDRVFQFYSGTCTSLTNITCLNADSGKATGLTPGTTYYIRTYTWSTNVFSNFTLCLSLPPVNDICSGAIPFPTLATGGVCTSVNVNTRSSSQSSTGCNGSADDDVWYSFVVPAGYTSVTFKATSISGSTDRVFQFYSGTCTTLSNMACLNADSGTVSGLTPGTTYYIRAYTWAVNVSSNFDLCLKLPVLTGIEEAGKSVYGVSPNPAGNFISINAHRSAIGSAFTIYDLAGRSRMTGTITGETTTSEISQLSNGIYMIYIAEQKGQPLMLVKQ